MLIVCKKILIIKKVTIQIILNILENIDIIFKLNYNVYLHKCPHI